MLCFSPLLLCVLLLPAVLPSIKATEYKSEEVILEVRQSFSCNNNNSQCYPDGVSSVPSRLVECVNNFCSCNECFENGDDGRCMALFTDNTCYFYNSGTTTCQDDRRSQLVAFLLSLFLSGVGAANFYVGQTGLAAGQLVLFLSIFLISCLAICLPCCLMCCIMGDEAKGSVIAIIFFILVFIVVFAVSLAMVAWWIADAVIFGLNNRNDGDGCPLKPF